MSDMSGATDLERRPAPEQAVEGVTGVGKRVVGLNVDGAKVEKLGADQSYIRHIEAERIVKARSRFRASTDFSELGSCDAIIVCVPTPLSEGRDPDLSYVAATAQTIAKHLRANQLVVLESTTYPGTTEEVVQPILEATGLRVGKDFHLAFSPEREDPGNARYSTKTIPKLVGGVSPQCGEVAAALYRSFLESVVVDRKS